jgi:hypothetical protein
MHSEVRKLKQNENWNTDRESLVKKLEELKNLPFPESPKEPFLDNLYIELADYDIYVNKIVTSILEGQRLDRQSIQMDEGWNERLESFNPAEIGADKEFSSLKEYKEVLDEVMRAVIGVISY